MTSPEPPTVRPAEPGELCTCGRRALDVLLGGDWGATGHCGLNDGGAPVDGVCTFCGDTVDHEHYARAEQAAGRPYLAYWPSVPQGERCPLYRLRLADPLPDLHPESVRRFDPAADRLRRAERRLRADLIEALRTVGADFTATYTLPLDVDEADPETGDLEAAVGDIEYGVARELTRDEHGAESRDEHAGQEAVAVLVHLLRHLLDDVGVAPNPLAGLDTEALIERAGGPDAWLATPALDRPLLITRRVVRRALDPEVPHDIHRPWFT